MAQKQKLEGQLIPLATAGEAVIGQPLSDSDLDEMVNNFRPASAADHIPIRFGRANGRGPVIAKVSALQKSGDKLVGKLANVDPRFDELYASGKLGGRAARSLAFERDDEKGKSIGELGFHPPRVFYGGAWHDGPSTDAALDDLLDAHRQGDALTFCAGDAGHLELVFPKIPNAGRAAKRASASSKSNSVQLHELTLQHMEQRNMKPAEYGDALTAVARQRPELTQERPATAERQQTSNPFAGYRFQTNSERLNEVAKALADELEISFGEALSQVAHDNPALTLPDGVLCMAEGSKGLRNDEELTRRAKELQSKKKISFGEALSRVSTQHPDLTLPGMYKPS